MNGMQYPMAQPGMYPQPYAPPPPQAAPVPPSMAGTALFSTLGAAMGAAAVEAGMAIADRQPASAGVRYGVTALGMALGAVAGGSGYRHVANKNYEAAQGGVSINPGAASDALRVRGRVGRTNIDFSMSPQDAYVLAGAINSVRNPTTPPAVHEWWAKYHEEATRRATEWWTMAPPPADVLGPPPPRQPPQQTPQPPMYGAPVYPGYPPYGYPYPPPNMPPNTPPNCP